MRRGDAGAWAGTQGNYEQGKDALATTRWHQTRWQRRVGNDALANHAADNAGTDA